MAEIDPSIYGKLQQPVNPLGVANDMIGLQQGMTANALARRQLQGSIGLGSAVQEATDDKGVVDRTKLGNILKRPENNAAAAAGAGLALDLQQKQLATEQAGMQIGDTGRHNLGVVWGARLANMQGDIDPATLRQDVLDLAARRGMDPADALAAIRMIPSDPKATRAFVTSNFLPTMGAAGIAGAAPAAPGPGGEQRQQTAGQFVTQSVGGEQPPPGSVPAGPAPTPAAGGGGAPGVTTGLSLARQQALPAVAKSAVDSSTALERLAQDVPNRKGMLDNMLSDLPEFTSGPVSEDLKTAIAGINEVFGTKFDVERVAAQERFDKLANQIALTQAGSLGVTDERVQTAMGANPSSRFSNLGNQQVIALLKGNEDALKIKEEIWQDSKDQTGWHDEDFYKFSKWFNQHFDPRVFQSVYMDPGDWKKMVNTMPKSERDILRDKYNFAVQNGWIPDPRRQ